VEKSVDFATFVKSSYLFVNKFFKSSSNKAGSAIENKLPTFKVGSLFRPSVESYFKSNQPGLSPGLLYNNIKYCCLLLK